MKTLETAILVTLTTKGVVVKMVPPVVPDFVLPGHDIEAVIVVLLDNYCHIQDWQERVFRMDTPFRGNDTNTQDDRRKAAVKLLDELVRLCK